MSPKISVVTPTYNCAKYIKGCIESVRDQESPVFEHIVVDGASTDGTTEILKTYPHLSWISEPDNGEAEALNKALRKARGDFIGWLNADDIYTPWAVKRFLEEREKHPEYDVYYGICVFINEEGKPTHWAYPYSPITVKTLLRWWQLNLFQPSIFFKRELVERVGYYREDLTYGTDYEYWFRLAASGARFRFVPTVFSKARINRSDGKTATPYHIKAREWLNINMSYQKYVTREERASFWRDFYLVNFLASPELANTKPPNKEAAEGYLLALIKRKAATPGIIEKLSEEYSLGNTKYLALLEIYGQVKDFKKAREMADRYIQRSIQEKKNNLNLPLEKQVKVKRERKKREDTVLLFDAGNIWPITCGTDRVIISDIQALREAGFKVCVFGTTLNYADWSRSKVERFKKELGVEVFTHRSSLSDDSYLSNNTASSVTPSLLYAFEQCVKNIKPKAIVINRSSFYPLLTANSARACISLLRMHAFCALNKAVLDALRPYFPHNEMYDPDAVSDEILKEDFINSIAINLDAAEEEIFCYKNVDKVLTLTKLDKEIVEENVKEADAVALSPYFPINKKENYSGNPIFVASLYPPNVQGYCYFTKKVLPYILRRTSSFSLDVIGTASKRLRSKDGIILRGFVENIDEVYQKASFAVCPLLAGTGLQIKAIEAMSWGLPVVALRGISKALPIVHQENGFIAENSKDFAEYVERLYLDRDLCKKMGERARETIAEKFSCKKVGALFRALIKPTDSEKTYTVTARELLL
ncbi:MAG: glycosyltransferase [Candidatus Dadabacteria bacterium]|nr:MAG: glycosyltransferase [Candidatus Dadabacteria bacterium]